MNPGTILSLGKFSLLIVRVRNFGLMYFAFQEIEKKENGERRRDQRSGHEIARQHESNSQIGGTECRG